MAHVRRPFYELYEAHQSAVAKEALERIAALYAIEEEIRGRSAEERRQVRSERSKPRLSRPSALNSSHFLTFGASGHQHAYRQDGLYGLGRCG
jgi:Transposase IS66 family